jgi:hypothetical protein
MSSRSEQAAVRAALHRAELADREAAYALGMAAAGEADYLPAALRARAAATAVLRTLLLPGHAYRLGDHVWVATAAGDVARYPLAAPADAVVPAALDYTLITSGS